MTIISNGCATCLRRSYRATRRGYNTGRRHDPHCWRRPTALRVPSDNTIRRCSPRLVIASLEPCSPRCIAADRSPSDSMIRPSREPGRKAPRRPHVPVNALDLHHKPDDALVPCDFLYSGRREEPHRPIARFTPGSSTTARRADRDSSSAAKQASQRLSVDRRTHLFVSIIGCPWLSSSVGTSTTSPINRSSTNSGISTAEVSPSSVTDSQSPAPMGL